MMLMSVKQMADFFFSLFHISIQNIITAVQVADVAHRLSTPSLHRALDFAVRASAQRLEHLKPAPEAVCMVMLPHLRSLLRCV